MKLGNTMNDHHQKISAFLASSHLDNVPASAISEAKRSMLDTIGCMIAGIDTPLGQGMRKLARRFKDENGTRVLGMTTFPSQMRKSKKSLCG